MIWQFITIDVFYSIFFLCYFVDSYLFMQSLMPYLSPDWISALCSCLYELTEKGPSQITSIFFDMEHLQHGPFAANPQRQGHTHMFQEAGCKRLMLKMPHIKILLGFWQQLATFPSGFPTEFLGKLAGKITNGDHIIVGCLAMSCKCKQLPSSQTAILWLQGNATAVLWALILCHGNFEWLMNKWSVRSTYTWTSENVSIGTIPNSLWSKEIHLLFLLFHNLSTICNYSLHFS